MSSTHNPGRVAGLWYLHLIAMGPIFLICIPDKLYAKGNAAATVSNIVAHERLFRVGILAELVGAARGTQREGRGVPFARKGL